MLTLGMTRRLLPVLVALAAIVPAAPRAQVQSADELASALQRKYEGIRDFATDFVHTYRGGALRRQLTERGRLLVKKPGKMRWIYTAPEEKLFVSDGVKIYSYIPADKQVIVTSVPADDTATTPALFLAGKGNLTRDFTASFGTQLPDSVPTNTKALKLVPRKPQPDYESLVLLVDPATLTLRGLVTEDAQSGTSTLVFSNLKENVTLSDKDFTFSIPRGVDVVTDAGQR
jgi:outer membrane lipoprotein carrier protein